MNEYSWFWVSSAIGTCAIAFAIAYSSVNSPDNTVAYVKAGLEQCVKSKVNSTVIWVKDCTKYLRYIEEGKYTEAEAQTKVNSF